MILHNFVHSVYHVTFDVVHKLRCVVLLLLLPTLLGRFRVRISVWRPTVLTDYFCGFPTTFLVKTRVEAHLQIRNDCFLPHPFQFTIHIYPTCMFCVTSAF
jgi:hypothetical protein